MKKKRPRAMQPMGRSTVARIRLMDRRYLSLPIEKVFPFATVRLRLSARIFKRRFFGVVASTRPCLGRRFYDTRNHH
jgi:hypothetical protein